MNKKVRTIGIIIISILLIILIAIIIYNVVYLSKEDDKQSSNEIKHISLDYKTLENCYNELDCESPYSEYATIKTDITSSNLMNILNNLNTKINDSYNKSLNSTDMTTPGCVNYTNLYQRSIMTQNNLTIYDSDDLLGFTLLSEETNLCTSLVNEDLEVYIYDVKNDKVLTEDEFKERYDITDDIISATIEANVNATNEIYGLSYTTEITEYNLYIQNDGTIGIYYKQPEENLYYNILLDKRV